MDRRRFIDFMEKPELLNADSISSINEVIGQFPYFQTPRLLMLKSLHKINNIRYNKELKITAAYAADRIRLYELINPADDKITAEYIKFEEKKELSEQEELLISSMTYDPLNETKEA